ncbi:hypothetical protein HYH03_007482 [Edaphochlamys debaryana]|uniref:Guanylate cyclase domain-containing protein n=1 Tax=Edaphochlamys debaryana TaxID=47281 RepID=A0A835Y203_9CHLO|nr:hypothetical protein HYH03_007482 [Edaphochlamys debaryana]|eukprot:KAG2494430.1 hypothetical protein HYH03_007482 [Edaphochlamys debaryana]
MHARAWRALLAFSALGLLCWPHVARADLTPCSATFLGTTPGNSTREAGNHIRVLSGLRVAAPFYATLAREQGRRALIAGSASVSAVDLEVTREPVDGLPGPAGPDQPDVQLLGQGEAAARPLLEALAAGNSSWLQQLELATAKGARLPPFLLSNRPDRPGGPAVTPLVLLYRRDWWDRWVASGAVGGPSVLNSVPATWDGFARLLSSLLNKDLDGDGRADHVLCADLMPGCKGWAVLSAILASMVQSKGNNQGIWVDADGRPAIGSAATPAALRLYARLAASNAAPFTPGGSLSTVPLDAGELLAAGGDTDPTTGTPLCGAVNPLFAAGRCLFTIDWAVAALRLTQQGAPKMAGRLGASLLPGSLDVVDGSGGLGQCTAQSCPFATTLRLSGAGPSSGGARGGGGGGGGGAPTQGRRLQQAGNGGTGPGQSGGGPSGGPGGRPSQGQGPAGQNTSQPQPQPQPQLQPQAQAQPQARGEAQPGPSAGLPQGAPAADGASPSPVPTLLVNQAPLVGEVTYVWAQRANLSAADAEGVDDFMRLVGLELGLKYGMLFSRPVATTGPRAAVALPSSITPGGMTRDSSLPVSTLPPGGGGAGSPLPAVASNAITIEDVCGSTGPPGDSTFFVQPSGTATAVAVEALLDLKAQDADNISLALHIALRHRNAAIDITTPYSSSYRQVVDDLAARALAAFAAAGAFAANDSDSSGAAALLWDDGALRPQLQALALDARGQFQVVLDAFPYPAIWRALYVYPFPANGSALLRDASPSSGRSLPLGLPIGVGVGCGVLVVCVAAAVGVLLLRKKKRRQAAKPPGPGPATTLALTDVQNSTLLWETLPPGLMDVCLGIHHRTLRQAIADNRGFECFTEGDAFAVAFHGPDDALGFAMDLQVALLSAEWPEPLLEQPDGCELWAQGVAPEGAPQTPPYSPYPHHSSGQDCTASGRLFPSSYLAAAAGALGSVPRSIRQSPSLRCGSGPAAFAPSAEARPQRSCSLRVTQTLLSAGASEEGRPAARLPTASTSPSVHLALEPVSPLPRLDGEVACDTPASSSSGACDPATTAGAGRVPLPTVKTGGAGPQQVPGAGPDRHRQARLRSAGGLDAEGAEDWRSLVTWDPTEAVPRASRRRLHVALGAMADDDGHVADLDAEVARGDDKEGSGRGRAKGKGIGKDRANEDRDLARGAAAGGMAALVTRLGSLQGRAQRAAASFTGGQQAAAPAAAKPRPEPSTHRLALESGNGGPVMGAAPQTGTAAYPAAPSVVRAPSLGGASGLAKAALRARAASLGGDRASLSLASLEAEAVRRSPRLKLALPATGAKAAFDELWQALNTAAVEAAAGVVHGSLPSLTGRSGSGSDCETTPGLQQHAFCVAESVGSVLRRLFVQADSEACEGGQEEAHRGRPQLVLRGLRVRVGMTSGLDESEVETVDRNGMQTVNYAGDFLAIAKEISDAAVGGMVLLSGSAFLVYQQLRNQPKPKAGSGAHPNVMVLHLGELVQDQAIAGSLYNPETGSSPGQARSIYCAVSPGLAVRLALLQPLVRHHWEVVPGCMSAPAGMVAPVFCNVAGVETLLAWERVTATRAVRMASETSRDPAGAGEVRTSEKGGAPPTPFVRAALDLFCELANQAASRHNGYVVAVSSDGGHWVLVFPDPVKAVQWGLEMLDAMLRAEWPEGFLDHELTEEVLKDGVLVKRGLRLRIGIDYGRAMVRLVPRTGRLDYVGRPMNRAARIAAKAKPATVLASGAAWEAASGALEPRVAATGLGCVPLKGVREPLELWALAPAREAGGVESLDAA